MFQKNLKIQFEGKVIKGRGRGECLGFPTINVAASDINLTYGVYFCAVECSKGEFYGVMHYGSRPTFEDPEFVCEIHLLDFEGELGGEYVKVYVFDFLRETIKFENQEELKKYIEADIVRARFIISENA